MKKFKTYILLIFVVLMLSGCKPGEINNFSYGKILMDKQGQIYFVKHYIGKMYTIDKIKD